MKVQKQSEVVLENRENAQICEVDTSNTAHFFQMMINTYSDPIGSLIREITSNAFDATIELMKETGEDLDTYLHEHPIDVRIKEGMFEVEDYGVGISPERIDNMYKMLGASTKRDSDDFIGQKGIGKFSPLSYTPTFDIRTRYNGVEYLYKMVKEDIPVLVKIVEYPTNEINGTLISVPITKGDEKVFRNSINRELKYFTNVWFTNCGDNEYKIVQRENYLVRKDTAYNSQLELELVIGMVRYPLDIEKIWDSIYYLGFHKWSVSQCPIALKFKIGELPILPNREHIEYNDKSKLIIADKLKNAFFEIKEEWEKKSLNMTDFKKYLYSIDQFAKIHGIDIDFLKVNKPTYKPFVDLGINESISKVWINLMPIRGVFTANGYQYLPKENLYIKKKRFHHRKTTIGKVTQCFSYDSVYVERLKKSYATVGKGAEITKWLNLLEKEMYAICTDYDAIVIPKVQRVKKEATVVIHTRYNSSTVPASHLSQIENLIWCRYDKRYLLSNYPTRDTKLLGSIKYNFVAIARDSVKYLPKDAIYIGNLKTKLPEYYKLYNTVKLYNRVYYICGVLKQVLKYVRPTLSKIVEGNTHIAFGTKVDYSVVDREMVEWIEYVLMLDTYIEKYYRGYNADDTFMCLIRDNMLKIDSWQRELVIDSLEKLKYNFINESYKGKSR